MKGAFGNEGALPFYSTDTEQSNGLLFDRIGLESKMFVTAIALAAEYTHPVVISTRTRDGKVSTNCGSFVLVNADGWILTAAHVLQPHYVAQEHRASIANYEKQRKAVEENPEIANAVIGSSGMYSNAYRTPASKSKLTHAITSMV